MRILRATGTVDTSDWAMRTDMPGNLEARIMQRRPEVSYTSPSSIVEHQIRARRADTDALSETWGPLIASCGARGGNVSFFHDARDEPEVISTNWDD